MMATAIDFKEIFGNANPVEVEIGCGKGKFLVARAENTPELNFLGLDRVGKWMKKGQKRRDKRDLKNLRFFKAEVRAWFEDLPSEAVRVFHIYFPDPWPKKRHHKRRLINAAFLRVLYEKLEPQGIIELATDHAHYFEQMKDAVETCGVDWKEVRESRERIAHPECQTNYELKYAAAGKVLNYLELVKP